MLAVQLTSKHISDILDGFGPQVDWQDVGSQEAREESVSFVAIWMSRLEFWTIEELLGHREPRAVA